MDCISTVSHTKCYSWFWTSRNSRVLRSTMVQECDNYTDTALKTNQDTWNNRLNCILEPFIIILIMSELCGSLTTWQQWQDLHVTMSNRLDEWKRTARVLSAIPVTLFQTWAVICISGDPGWTRRVHAHRIQCCYSMEQPLWHSLSHCLCDCLSPMNAKQTSFRPLDLTYRSWIGCENHMSQSKQGQYAMQLLAAVYARAFCFETLFKSSQDK